MSTTATLEQPRFMARIAGVFYLVSTACALFSYLYVRDQVIDVDDMAQTAANFVAHDTGGTGLGLSIARDVAQADGGNLTLRNRSEGGLIAELRLPRRR